MTNMTTALLQKPVVVQMGQKFPSIYETRSFIVVFTRSRNWFV